MAPVTTEETQEMAEKNPETSAVCNEGPQQVDYKRKYKVLKKKLRLLVYEQECFMDELRKAQKKLLKVSRDRSFLLDRLLQYEKIDDSASDSDGTASTDSEGGIKKSGKKKKSVHVPPPFGGLFPDQDRDLMSDINHQNLQPFFLGGEGSPAYPVSSFLSQTAVNLPGLNPLLSPGPPRKKLKTSKKIVKSAKSILKQQSTMEVNQPNVSSLSREEIERRLDESASKPSYMRIDKATASMPMDIFSNEDSNPDSENPEDLVIDVPLGE